MVNAEDVFKLTCDMCTHDVRCDFGTDWDPVSYLVL